MVRTFRSEKDLRLFLRKFLRERLRGLPADFRIGIEVRSVRPPRATLKLPVHSEANPARAHEVDRLVAELEARGLELEVFYLDDETEVLA